VLAWRRTRHAFINEVYREQAQHVILAALLRKLRANASLTHVTTLDSVADAATKALSVDPGRSTARPARQRDPVWIALGALLALILAITISILITGAFLQPLSALFNSP